MIPFSSQHVTLPNFQNVAAGSTATLQVPVGVTYHKIVLTYRDNNTDELKTIEQVNTDLEKVRLKVNGEVKRDLTAESMASIYEQKGSKYAQRAGKVPFYFSEPWRENIAEILTPALGTYDLRANQGTVSIEVKIHKDAVAPKLEAHAIITNDNRLMERFTQYVEWELPVTAAGKVSKQDFPRIGELVAYHVFADKMTHLGIKVESADVLDNDIAVDVIEEENLANGGVSIAGLTSYHFDRENRLGNNLKLEYYDLGTKQKFPLVSDFRVDHTFSGAETARIVLERLDTR